MLNERLIEMVNSRLLDVYKTLWEELPNIPLNEVDPMFEVINNLKDLMIRVDTRHRKYILKIQFLTTMERTV